VLYADDLVLVAENEVGAAEKLRRWKDGMESKGLRIIIVKTKVIHIGAGGGTVITEGVWPCAVCQ